MAKQPTWEDGPSDQHRKKPTMKRRSIQEKRFIYATIMTSTVVVALALACCAPTAQAQNTSRDGPLTTRIWESISSGSSVEDALVDVGFSKLSAEEIPAWMLEICDASLLDGAIIDKDLGLISITRSDSEEDVAHQIENDLVERGWLKCDSDHENVTTFIKTQGECRWLMVETTEVGEGVNVVLHTERA